MSARRWFAAAVAAYTAAWVLAAVLLPERVPVHFGLSGEVDRWAGRTGALVAFALIGAGVAALLWGAAALGDRVPLSQLNTPRKDWWAATPERVAELRRRGRRDLEVIGAATMALLTAVLLGTVRAARAETPRLGAVFLALVAVYVVFVLVWVVRAHRDRRAAGED
ncbi:DUF1648 domain-containing protein [Nocardioides humi]|uniref:DUF1648 domain-containing protein n=1 Tax=Nocardioides humi TaxID=449461 RepID=A0ABN2BH15_9ACTN|nr:DUF1648 domain-containing protein [Nocardioides humi]